MRLQKELVEFKGDKIAVTIKPHYVEISLVVVSTKGSL